MFLEEMVGITREYPGISECGFWIAGLNPVVDWILTPVIAVSMRIAPERLGPSMGRLMLWGLSRFSRPPFGTKLTATVAGERDGQSAVTTATLSHPDMYDFTAIPATACLLQYADGTSRRPGLWLQGMLVEPQRLMTDMRRLGVLIDRRGRPGS